MRKVFECLACKSLGQSVQLVLLSVRASLKWAEYSLFYACFLQNSEI